MAQRTLVVENGTLLKTKGGDRYVGRLIDSSPDITRLVTPSGDTTTIRTHMIKRLLHPEEVLVFRDARYHYKRGHLLNASMSFSDGFFALDVSYNERFFNRLELGVGTGLHINQFSFATTTDWHDVSVHSMPIYGQAKYIFKQGRKQLYAKARVGYANNYNTWNVYNVKDGITMDGGVGISFATKRHYKYFVELSQYYSRASGFAKNRSPNAISDIDFDIKFYNFIFTMGMEFGKK